MTITLPVLHMSRPGDTRGVVALWEPEREGVKHSSTNAALVSALRAAYPNSQIAMLGEESHLQAVIATLREARQDSAADDVRWVPTRTYRTIGGRLSRVRTWFRYWDGRRRLARMRPNRLLVSSTTGTGVRLVRGRRSCRGMRTVVVVHQTNDLLGAPSTLTPSQHLLREALRSDRSPDVRFLATTARALEPLGAIVGRSRVAALDLPQLASVSLEDRLAGPSLEQRPARFGIFGILTTSALDAYVGCAREIHEQCPDAAIMLIGFVTGAVGAAEAREIDGVSTRPLTPAEYARRARSVDYALFLRSPPAYAIRLSASAQDCLSYLVPPISTENAFIDELAAAAPTPIGFTGLARRSDVAAVALRLLQEPDAQDHERQCRALCAVRDGLVPEAVAHRLRAAFDSESVTDA